jgi:hypothetical protein
MLQERAFMAAMDALPGTFLGQAQQFRTEQAVQCAALPFLRKLIKKFSRILRFM